MTHKESLLVKISIIALILAAPVVLVVVGLRPFVADEEQNKFLVDYRLPPDFTYTDFAAVIERMKDNAEFRYYYQIFSEDVIERAAAEIYDEIDDRRSPESHLEYLNAQKEKVSALAAVFNNLDFPGDFVLRPWSYPQLNTAVWTFMYEDFKLAAVGATYKSTYDLGFRLVWGDGVHGAGQRLTHLLDRMEKEGGLDLTKTVSLPR